MCTYGSQCTRPSCFFAHSLEELRVPWKGVTAAVGGGAIGGDQQQQAQQQSQHSHVQGQHQQNPFSGNAGAFEVAVEGSETANGSGSGDVAATSAAARTASLTVPAQVASSAGATSGGSTSRSRPMMQTAAPGLQQQLHQQSFLQSAGMLPQGGAGGGAGGSVVDVRLVAGARAMSIATVLPLQWGGESTLSDPSWKGALHVRGEVAGWLLCRPVGDSRFTGRVLV